MSQTHTVSSDPASGHDPGQTASRHQLVLAEVHHRRRLSHFWRHFLEMLAAMVVGMIATGAIFVSKRRGVAISDDGDNTGSSSMAPHVTT